MILQLDHWFLDTVTGTLAQDSNFTNIVSTLDHTPLELLLCLIRYQGEDVSKDTMLSEVWPNKVVSEDVLSVAISQIRKALGDKARKPTFIKTIPGVGYKFIANVVESTAEEKTAKQIPKTILKPEVQAEPTINTNKLQYVVLIIILVITVSFFWMVNNTATKAITSIDQLPSQTIINHYQKGRYLLAQNDKDKWIEAQQIFEDTIIQVPNYAPVYRELAEAKYKIVSDDTLAQQKIYQDLLFLLNKSLTLQPDDTQTLLNLANYHFSIGWDFVNAEKYYQQLLALSPNSIDANFIYAQFQLAKGNAELALKHLQIYTELEPKSYAVPSVAWVYNMMEDYDSALKEVEKLTLLEPTHDIKFSYHSAAQNIYENANNVEKAGEHLLAVLKLANYSEQHVANTEAAYQEGGLTNVYAWLLDVKKEPGYIGQYTPPLSFARYAIGAGEIERAVDYLLEAKEQRQTSLLWFNIDPKYKSIKNHPKLKGLVPID